jgi:hypothetical protein
MPALQVEIDATVISVKLDMKVCGLFLRTGVKSSLPWSGFPVSSTPRLNSGKVGT